MPPTLQQTFDSLENFGRAAGNLPPPGFYEFDGSGKPLDGYPSSKGWCNAKLRPHSLEHARDMALWKTAAALDQLKAQGAIGPVNYLDKKVMKELGKIRGGEDQ